MTNHWKTLVVLGFALVGVLATAFVTQPAGAWSHYGEAPTPTSIPPPPTQTPLAVELQVIETEPGFKGDTATAGNKPAKLETGITIQVPLFVNTGETIKVDTRNGNYLERVS